MNIFASFSHEFRREIADFSHEFREKNADFSHEFREKNADFSHEFRREIASFSHESTYMQLQLDSVENGFLRDTLGSAQIRYGYG